MTFRRENMQQPKVQVVEDSFLKERYLNLEKNYDDLKLEVTPFLALELKTQKLMSRLTQVNFKIPRRKSATANPPTTAEIIKQHPKTEYLKNT